MKSLGTGINQYEKVTIFLELIKTQNDLSSYSLNKNTNY